MIDKLHKISVFNSQLGFCSFLWKSFCYQPQLAVFSTITNDINIMN